MNRLPANLLIILAHHIGELDGYFPLILLLRQSRPSWRTHVLVTKKSAMIQISKSTALLAMMNSLEIQYSYLPVNAINEPAEYSAIAEHKGKNSRNFTLRIFGRLRSYLMAIYSLPALIRDLRGHDIISVEGTQYSSLISLICVYASFNNRTLFLHNHSVQPIVTLPRKKRLVICKKSACGIVFSNTELSRYLYGSELHDRTYRTGLLKYLTVWTEYCRRQSTEKNPKSLGIFTKRISFEVYRELLIEFLFSLVEINWSDLVLIKPHPMDKIEEYFKIIEIFPTLKLKIVTEPNFALMPLLKAAICFPGSSILDCDAFGVPAIELRPETDTFGPGKIVTTDYAESGYLSTSYVDDVITWLTSLGKHIQFSEKNTSLHYCGTNDLNIILIKFLNSGSSVFEH